MTPEAIPVTERKCAPSVTLERHGASKVLCSIRSSVQALPSSAVQGLGPLQLWGASLRLRAYLGAGIVCMDQQT